MSDNAKLIELIGSQMQWPVASEALIKIIKQRDDAVDKYVDAVGKYHTASEKYLECTQQLEEKRNQINILIKENEKLREDALQVMIEEIVYKDGVFDATMKTGLGPILAEFVREIMKSHNGENFVTTSFSFSDDIDSYYITFGRKLGKSVDEKYSYIYAQNKKMLASLKSVVSLFDRACSYQDYDADSFSEIEVARVIINEVEKDLV